MRTTDAKSRFSTIVLMQAVAALLTLLPLLCINLASFTGNTDSLFYTTIQRLTAHHMASGELFPGWLPEANGGTGSPVMVFYSRFAYQLTAILGSPLSFIDPLGWKRVIFSIFAAQFVGGLSSWFWLNRHFSTKAAIIGSLLFTLFPYKWIYIYLHINLAQLWALAWLPLLMAAAEDMALARRNATIWYGIWLAMLAITHLPTFIAFGLVPVIYVAIFSTKGWRSWLVTLAEAHLIALALSAFYLLPAILNKSLVQAAQFTREQWNYATNLNHYDLVLNFHYAILVALVIGMMFRVPAWRQTAAGRHARFWLITFGVIVFLCVSLSRFLWDHIGLLQIMQFPVARFHAVALIAACALTALFIDNRHRIIPASPLYSTYVLLTAVALMTAYDLRYVFHVYQQPNDITMHYVEEMHDLNVIAPREYLTKWQPANTNSLELAESAHDLPMAIITKGAGSSAGIVNENGTISVRANVMSKEATLHVHQLYWPAWRSSGVAPEPDKNGFMSFTLPKGQQGFTLTLGPLPGDLAGAIISLLAWLITLLFFSFEATKGRD